MVDVDYMVNNNKKESFLTLDVTNTSIKMFSFESGEDLFKLKGASFLDSKELLTHEDVKNLVNDCALQSENNPKDVVLGLSGEHVFGFLLIVKSKRDEPLKKISKKEIEQIYIKLRDLALVQAKTRWETNFAYEVDLEILDLVITAMAVDGVNASDPVGKTGESISIAVYCSFANKKHYDWANKLVTKNGLTVSETTTTLYSQSKLLSDLNENFILVDIGFKYTDIGIVFGKNLIETKCFDIGGDYFTQYLEKEKNLKYETANAKKESYSDGTLADDEMDSIGDLLYEAGKIWILGLKTVLSSLSDIRSFPSVIYLTGGGAELNLLVELLHENEWAKEIPFSSELDITVVNTDTMKGSIKDDQKLLYGIRMFAPASLSVIKRELT